MPSELRTRVMSGLRWSSLATAIVTALTFANSLVLARLIEPRAFGLVAMMAFFRGLTEVFSARTLGEALIFHQDSDARDERAVFGFALLNGLCLAGLLATCAPLIAAFYGERALVPLVQLGALQPLIVAAGVVPTALVRRQLRFAAQAKVQVAGALANAVVALSGALRGWGAWALVAGELAQVSTELAGMLFAARFRPRVALWSARMPTLLRYARDLLFTNFFTYLARQSDRAAIGRYCGAAAIGQYQRALGIPTAFSNPLVSVVESVLLPSLMQVRDDTPRLKSLCLRAVGVSAFVFAPSFAGVALVAEPLVLLLFGPQWRPAAELLQITAWTALCNLIGRPIVWIYRVRGETGQLVRWTLGSGVLFTATVFVAATSGSPRTVALALLSVSLAMVIPRSLFAGRIVGIGVRDVLRALAGPAVATGFMVACVELARRGLDALAPERSALASLVPLVATGALAYLSIAYVLRLPALREARAFLPARFRRDGA